MTVNNLTAWRIRIRHSAFASLATKHTRRQNLSSFFSYIVPNKNKKPILRVALRGKAKR